MISKFAPPAGAGSEKSVIIREIRGSKFFRGSSSRAKSTKATHSHESPPHKFA
jgi:hypothetical protein